MVCPRCGSDQVKMRGERVICSNCGELDTYRKCKCGRAEKLTRCSHGYDIWVKMARIPFDVTRLADIMG